MTYGTYKGVCKGVV